MKPSNKKIRVSTPRRMRLSEKNTDGQLSHYPSSNFMSSIDSEDAQSKLLEKLSQALNPDMGAGGQGWLVDPTITALVTKIADDYAATGRLPGGIPKDKWLEAVLANPAHAAIIVSDYGDRNELAVVKQLGNAYMHSVGSAYAQAGQVSKNEELYQTGARLAQAAAEGAPASSLLGGEQQDIYKDRFTVPGTLSPLAEHPAGEAASTAGVLMSVGKMRGAGYLLSAPLVGIAANIPGINTLLQNSTAIQLPPGMTGLAAVADKQVGYATAKNYHASIESRTDLPPGQKEQLLAEAKDNVNKSLEAAISTAENVPATTSAGVTGEAAAPVSEGFNTALRGAGRLADPAFARVAPGATAAFTAAPLAISAGVSAYNGDWQPFYDEAKETGWDAARTGAGLAAGWKSYGGLSNGIAAGKGVYNAGRMAGNIGRMGVRGFIPATLAMGAVDAGRTMWESSGGSPEAYHGLLDRLEQGVASKADQSIWRDIVDAYSLPATLVDPEGGQERMAHLVARYGHGPEFEKAYKRPEGMSQQTWTDLREVYSQLATSFPGVDKIKLQNLAMVGADRMTKLRPTSTGREANANVPVLEVGHWTKSVPPEVLHGMSTEQMENMQRIAALVGDGGVLGILYDKDKSGQPVINKHALRDISKFNTTNFVSGIHGIAGVAPTIKDVATMSFTGEDGNPVYVPFHEGKAYRQLTADPRSTEAAFLRPQDADVTAHREAGQQRATDRAAWDRQNSAERSRGIGAKYTQQYQDLLAGQAVSSARQATHRDRMSELNDQEIATFKNTDDWWAGMQKAYPEQAMAYTPPQPPPKPNTPIAPPQQQANIPKPPVTPIGS